MCLQCELISVCAACTMGFEHCIVFYRKSARQTHSSPMPVHPLNMHFNKLCRSPSLQSMQKLTQANPEVPSILCAITELFWKLCYVV